jgi:hypothetical protein
MRAYACVQTVGGPLCGGGEGGEALPLTRNETPFRPMRMQWLFLKGACKPQTADFRGFHDVTTRYS